MTGRFGSEPLRWVSMEEVVRSYYGPVEERIKDRRKQMEPQMTEVARQYLAAMQGDDVNEPIQKGQGNIPKPLDNPSR